MDTPELTEWEARERAGLLALETPEWCEKRLIAEDPNTTAAVLIQTATELEAFGAGLPQNLLTSRRLLPANSMEASVLALLLETLAAHPNSPPHALLSLVNSAQKKAVYLVDRSLLPSASARGICRNPVASLLLLEDPAFWLRLDKVACQMLLREAALPLAAVVAMQHHKEKEVAQVARFHVAVAGEIKTHDEGRAALTLFWRTFPKGEPFSSKMNKTTTKIGRIWRTAPIWLRWIVVPLFLIDFLVALTQGTEYGRFKAHTRQAVGFRNKQTVKMLRQTGTSPNWLNRLNTAFGLPLSTILLADDPWGRSPLDLLQHLAHDGNRFVRWAAQTRLADPDFVFTWHDGK